MKKNEKNYGRLDFDEKTSQFIKTEVLYDDYIITKPDHSETGLSSLMLKSAFGPQFNPMFEEAIFGSNSGLN